MRGAPIVLLTLILGSIAIWQIITKLNPRAIARRRQQRERQHQEKVSAELEGLQDLIDTNRYDPEKDPFRGRNQDG